VSADGTPAGPSGTPLRELLRGLLDDASLFPPSSLPMPAALAAHARHAAAWYRDLAGPFVCAETRLSDLRVVLTSSGTAWIDLSLVVTGGAAAVAAATDAVAADPRLRLRAVEVPVGRDADLSQAITTVVAALDAAPLAAATGYIEVPIAAIAGPDGSPQLIAMIDERGYRPKLRTGGVVKEAFPDKAALAVCLAELTARRIAFKCTAGLHHAVRHTAADTGLEHHGFLNVLLAVGAGAAGADADEIAGVLAQRDQLAIAAAVRSLDADAAAEIRSLFTSFGTCSTDEPVADLVSLGLLSKPGELLT
jgi:hypothetical protein